MNIEHFETLFSASESDADRVLVASKKIHEALLNTGLTDDALTQGLHIVIQRINQLNYSTQFLSKNIANDIISDLIRLVPAKDVELLTKFSWLVLNFLNKQTIVLERDVEHVTEYFLKTSRTIPLTPCNISSVVLHLRALGTVLYGNVRRLKPIHGKVVADLRILSQSSAPLVQSEAVPESDKLSLVCALVQCYENLSADSSSSNTPGTAYLNEEHQVAVIHYFLHALQKLSAFRCMEDSLYYKVVAGSLRGLKNVMEAGRTFPTDLVGHLVSLVQRYSVLGHVGPSVGQQETSANELELGKMRVSVEGEDPRTPSSNRPEEGSRSRTDVLTSTPHQKQKNKRQSKASKKLQAPDDPKRVDSDGENEIDPSGNSRADRRKDPSKDSDEDEFWAMFELSDSDLSDGELNQSFSRTSGKNFAAKIRTQALALLHTAVKCIDRKTMFGHWHSIFPDRFICNWNQLNNYPLFVTIIRDPSHKMRLAALSILTTLLDGSKQFLMAAEDGAQYHSVAYTPFSVSLGNTIKELHRCLLLTLTREQVPLVLVQAIKCLGTLVANSPYHRLKPGLLNRSVKFVSHFLSHKDANIKVVALTCLGNVVSVHAPLGEVIQLLGNKPSKVSFSSSGFFHQREKSKENGEESTNCYEDLDFKAILSSGSITPLLHGASEHCPELNADDAAAENQNGTHREMSWLLKSCTEIIMSGCTKKKPKIAPNTFDLNLSSAESSYVHVVPVRVEALQVLTLMTQNYFIVVRPHLKVIQDLAGSCLQNDPDNSIQLHAIKLLEALTSSVLSNQSADKISSPAHVSVKEALALWNYILKGPIQKALSNNADSMVEMVACECLGNVGSDVFEKLTEKSSDFIKTIILGFSSVSNHHICIGALSAVGRSVNYPCLSNDALFLADASNAVLRSLKTSNLGVVTKAAWVLSNLSDALVLKRMDNEFVSKISDCLLLKLLESCIELCSLHDKPRSNALRTIGNLLNFLPPTSLDDGKFDDAIRNSLQVIIKYIHSGSVKVRWNACYAFGNIMWNEPVLSFISYKMMEAYQALVKAVRTCKNFKVRISAATVLAIPSRREMFFQGDESKTSSRLFLGATNHKTFMIGRTESGNQASSVHFYRYTIRSRHGSLDHFHPGNYTLEVDVETEFGMMQSKEKKVGCREDCFGIVWDGVLSALLECESTPLDFTEMKYKSILMSRLIITLLHLLSLVVPGDLELCWKSLKGHEETITKYLQARNDGDVSVDHDNDDDGKPQGKGTVAHKVKIEDGLKEVSRHLSMLPKCASLTEVHLRAIEGLSGIFFYSSPEANPSENAENSMELKFFQVYD